MKNIFVELIDALSSNKVDFVVCGGVACFLYGIDRVTLDLDISVSFEKENLEKLINTAKQIGLKPRNPEPIENLLIEEKRNQWIEKKGALVYTLVSNDGFKQIDIFLRYHKTHEKLSENSKKMLISGYEVMVSSIDDLIEAKMRVIPPRDRDETDIKELRKLKDEQ
jgi:hypothetical protein